MSALAVFEAACGVVHEERVVSGARGQRNRPSEGPRSASGACASGEQPVVDHRAEDENGEAGELKPEQRGAEEGAWQERGCGGEGGCSHANLGLGRCRGWGQWGMRAPRPSAHTCT
jgi:hypothetical protein